MEKPATPRQSRDIAAAKMERARAIDTRNRDLKKLKELKDQTNQLQEKLRSSQANVNTAYKHVNAVKAGATPPERLRPTFRAYLLFSSVFGGVVGSTMTAVAFLLFS